MLKQEDAMRKIIVTVAPVCHVGKEIPAECKNPLKHYLFAMAMAAMLGSQSATAQNKVKNLYAESQSLKVEQVENQAQPVQLNRYLFAGYNTLCLPMSLSASQLNASNIRAERLTAIRQEGSTLCLYFVDCTDEGLEAGVPYLIYSPVKQYLRIKNTDANRIDSELRTIRLSDDKGNQIAFGSSWEKRSKNGLYGIPAKQNVTPLESVLVRTTEDLSFLPTRCGFNWESQSESADKLEIRHATASEVTAISTLTNDAVKGQGDAYDLSGRRITQTTKGISIVNGKKIVNK